MTAHATTAISLGDLTTATPAEVDTVLADLYEQAYRHETRAAQQYEEIRSWVGRQVHGKGYRSLPATRVEVHRYFESLEAKKNPEFDQPTLSYEDRQLLSMRERWHAERDAYLAAFDAQQPYHAEFDQRGGWTRAFLVTNTGGHVHSSRSCSTCFPTTHYAWLPQVSGLAEDEIVEMAGERACTVCYPSAPVEVLSKPTQFFTPDEEAKAKRAEEREAKRAAALEAQVVVDGMKGWTNEGRGRHVYKTVRGATNAIASNLHSLCWYGMAHPSSGDWVTNVEVIRAALAAKGVDYDYDKALNNARTKVNRNGGEAQF